MAASINASTSAGVVTTADTTGNLNLQSNGTTVLAMTSAGVAVTGTQSVSGAATLSSTLSVTGKITATTAGIDVPTSALGTCYASTYTPTITNGTNVASSTAFACRYVRIGDVVTVSGQVNVDFTAASTYTRIEMSLPVASNLSNTYELCGVAVGATGAQAHFGILASAGAGRAIFDGVSSSDVNQAFYFTLSYLVI